MRALLALFALCACASVALALSQLRAPIHAASAKEAVADEPAVTGDSPPVASAVAQAPTPPATSRGVLPFGAVPGAPPPSDDIDSDDGVMEESDRCPNEPETRDGRDEDDGCPDVTRTSEAPHRIRIDFEELILN